MWLTEDERQITGNGFTCPKCGADLSADPLPITLNGWDDDLFSGTLFIDVTCRSCGCEYTNIYQLTCTEITYDPEEER